MYKSHGVRNGSMELTILDSIPAHVVAYPVVVKEAFDASHRADCNVLIPEILIGESHNILLRNLANHALDLVRLHTASSGDNLAAHIFCNCSRTVKRQQDGRFQLRFSSFSLSLGYVERQTRPLPEGEVDQVIDMRLILSHQVDSP
jgi:hypothetical protein